MTLIGVAIELLIRVSGEMLSWMIKISRFQTSFVMIQPFFPFLLISHDRHPLTIIL